MKILITGKDSKIAQELLRRLKKNKVVAYNKAELDITDIAQIKEVVIKEKPSMIINCASLNDLKQAESNPEKAYAVNQYGVKNLVNISLDYDIKLIHFSTNYIFTGNQTEPYVETDRADPLNIYGKSKLKGENEILNSPDLKYLLFRTSWIYAANDDFLISELKLNSGQSQASYYPASALATPTSVSLLIELVIRSIKKNLTGIYNVSCSGFASQYDFAKEVVKICGINIKIKAKTSTDSDNILRPRFAVLDNSKISKDLTINIPEWDEELKHQLEKHDN